MGRPIKASIDPVADLKRRLARSYLRTAASRSMPIAKLRACVRAWWSDHELGDHPASVGKRIAMALIEQAMTEDKLAGILVLQDLLGDHLRAGDLPGFARLFADGHLADWNIVDWFSVRVLVTLLDREPGRSDVARTIAQWRTAETMWQRRAACLAFTRLAARGEHGIADLVLVVCSTVVWSHEHHDQTAVGLILRELSRAEPVRVEAFFRRYARLMSKECARYAIEKLPASRKRDLRAHYRRATSIRVRASAKRRS